jgi:MarR family 2-MHQ and catechol resistance regulon transcriptional repressor
MAPGTEESVRLWFMLMKTHYAISKLARRDIESRGITITEFSVMENLYRQGTLTLGDVGNCASLTSGSTTYVIDKLEQRGLIARRASDEDRRVIHTSLTDAGRELITSILPEHAKAIHAVMAGLSQEERDQLRGLLATLGNHAESRL